MDGPAGAVGRCRPVAVVKLLQQREAGRQLGPAVTGEPTGDRALRSPRTEKQRASTLAAGARRQAKRDSR